jgi:hypothetical protein
MLGTQPMLVVDAELDDILRFGTTPYGERRIVGIAGGTVSGRVTGRILPGGADWQIVRSDGATDIEAHYNIETGDGSLILVSSEGLRHGPPEVMDRLARGEMVDPALYYFRTVMRFESAAPALGWLNKVLALARGERRARSVRLEVFEVM